MDMLRFVMKVLTLVVGVFLAVCAENETSNALFSDNSTCMEVYITLNCSRPFNAELMFYKKNHYYIKRIELYSGLDSHMAQAQMEVCQEPTEITSGKVQFYVVMPRQSCVEPPSTFSQKLNWFLQMNQSKSYYCTMEWTLDRFNWPRIECPFSSNESTEDEVALANIKKKEIEKKEMEKKETAKKEMKKEIIDKERMRKEERKKFFERNAGTLPSVEETSGGVVCANVHVTLRCSRPFSALVMVYEYDKWSADDLMNITKLESSGSWAAQKIIEVCDWWDEWNSYGLDFYMMVPSQNCVEPLGKLASDHLFLSGMSLPLPTGRVVRIHNFEVDYELETQWLRMHWLNYTEYPF